MGTLMQVEAVEVLIVVMVVVDQVVLVVEVLEIIVDPPQLQVHRILEVEAVAHIQVDLHLVVPV